MDLEHPNFLSISLSSYENENILVHWKFRELIKIIEKCKKKNEVIHFSRSKMSDLSDETMFDWVWT